MAFHLWLLGALVYLNLFGIDTVENSWGLNWIHRDFTRNIQYFGLSLICVVFDIDDTGTRALNLTTKWKINLLVPAQDVPYALIIWYVLKIIYSS